MGRTFTQKITEEELAQKLLDAIGLDVLPGKTAKETIEYPYESKDEFVNGKWVPNPKYPGRNEFVVYFLHGDFGMDNNDYNRPLDKPIFSKFSKDISKVEFDFENVESYGIHKLENDLVFYAFSAGGDWEIPVYGIVYWDGKSLRGYIPKDGNTWNTATNKAYGNDEGYDLSKCLFCGKNSTVICELNKETQLPYCDEHSTNKTDRIKAKLRKVTEKDKKPDHRSDEMNMIERFGQVEPSFDIEKIKEDIMNRIVFERKQQ